MLTNITFNIPTAAGKTLQADLTYRSALPNAPLIIFVHGFKGFKDWGSHHLMARYFAKQGFRFLKFNFSHNGTSADFPMDFVDLVAFSENTFSLELSELQQVIDFAATGKAFAATQQVILLGHSMGGGISIVTAAEDARVSTLITFASIADFHNLWPKAQEETWKRDGVMHVYNARTKQQMPLKSTLLDDLETHAERLNIAQAAERITQPWLITHGDADPTVPVACAQGLQQLQPKAKLSIIPGADHVYGGYHPYPKDTLPEPLEAFCKLVAAFLTE